MRILVAVLCLFVLSSCSRDPNVIKVKYLQNGNKYFERGRYKEARIMYMNAVNKDRLYGQAYYRLGLAELKLGLIPQAVRDFRRAQEILEKTSPPEYWDAIIKLADIYLVVSREGPHMEEAEGIAGKLLEKDANSHDGHRLLGDVNFAGAQVAFVAKNTELGGQKLAKAVAEYRLADAAKPEQTGVRLALARALSASRDFAAAESLYQAVIAKEPREPVAYNELYQLFWWQKKLDEGEKTLKLALANNPKRYSLLTMLATHYFLMGKREDGVKVLQSLKAAAGDYPEAYARVGDFYLRLGDGDQAIREYREGLAKDEKRKVEYQKRIIEVLMRQGKKAEATQINAAILKADPKDSDARGLAASMLLDKGEVARAIAELQGVVSAAPSNPVARFHLGRAHMMRGEAAQARQQFAEAIKLRPDYLLPRLAMAQLHVKQGEFDGALKVAEEVLKLDAKNRNARLIQSAALMGMKRYGDSRQVLQGILEASPSSPDVMFQIGIVNLAENKFKEAEDAFRKSYQLNPANSRGLMGVVETYMAQNRPDEALQVLQAEAQRSPDRMEFRLAMGNTAVRAGKYDLALEQFQAALQKLDSKSRAAGDIYLRIGETQRRKRDMNAAVAALQKARELVPESALIISTLALTLDGAGRKQEARLAYEQTLKIEPNNGVALNNLAFLLAEAGVDLDQALTYAQRARQILPNMAEVADTLGWIYLKKNLSDNAIPIFRDLVNREPNHSTYRYHLGMALSQKGDRPSALKELEQALKSNPPKEEAGKIRELLNKLS